MDSSNWKAIVIGAAVIIVVSLSVAPILNYIRKWKQRVKVQSLPSESVQNNSNDPTTTVSRSNAQSTSNYNQTNTVPLNLGTFERISSDGGVLNNPSPPLHCNARRNNNNPAAETIQETNNWIRSHDLEIEFERCAQERRNRMARNTFSLPISPSIVLNDSIDLPQIFPTPESQGNENRVQQNTIQDDELPSELPTYEQAVAINA